MSLRVIHEIEEVQWTAFVSRHPNGNIFQTPEIYKVYKNTLNYEPIVVGVSDNDCPLLGIVVGVIQKEANGLIGKLTSRSIIFGGPLVREGNPEVMDLLLKGYNEKIKRKVIYTQIRNIFNQNNYRKIFEQNGFRYEAHLDILIKLDVSPDELVNRINREKRRNLTKSKNKGAQFREITSREELLTGLSLIRSTYKRVKIPLPDFSLFISAFDTLYLLGYVKIFGTFSESKMIGIRILLTYGDLVYDWFAGSDEEYKNMYPNDFLIFNILLWGTGEKYSVFDFGGAGKPNVPYGVREHKMKFGGDLVEFGRFEKTHNPLLMKLGTMGFKLYKKLKH